MAIGRTHGRDAGGRRPAPPLRSRRCLANSHAPTDALSAPPPFFPCSCADVCDSHGTEAVARAHPALPTRRDSPQPDVMRVRMDFSIGTPSTRWQRRPSSCGESWMARLRRVTLLRSGGCLADALAGPGSATWRFIGLLRPVESMPEGSVLEELRATYVLISARLR
jgi:hypothetical protein